MTRFAARVLLALTLPAFAYAGGHAAGARGGIASPSPAATKAGRDVLVAGGSAADAFVAAALTLAVTRPDSCGIGGGGLLVYYEAASRAVWTLDFRPVVPFERITGEDRPGARLDVAVPSFLAGLEAAHKRFGARPWKGLVAPALALARDGFVVDAELAAAIQAAFGGESALKEPQATVSLFSPGPGPRQAGSKLVQTDLAKTLERISKRGAKELSQGSTGRLFASAATAMGSPLSSRDLREAHASWIAPVAIRMADHVLYSVPPPAGGGGVLAQMSAVLAPVELDAAGFQELRSIHWLAETERRAMADWLAVVAPAQGPAMSPADLLSQERATAMRATIPEDRATVEQPDAPGRAVVPVPAVAMVVADAKGNLAAAVLTLGDRFGNHQIAAGTGLLFARLPDAASVRLSSGVRVPSLHAPLVLIRDGRPVVVLGSGGESGSPGVALQIVFPVMRGSRSLPEAINAPRYDYAGPPAGLLYEQGRAPESTVAALVQKGHAVAPRATIGEVYGIFLGGDQIVSVADPRHGGDAGGY